MGRRPKRTPATPANSPCLSILSVTSHREKPRCHSGERGRRTPEDGAGAGLLGVDPLVWRSERVGNAPSTPCLQSLRENGLHQTCWLRRLSVALLRTRRSPLTRRLVFSCSRPPPATLQQDLRGFWESAKDTTNPLRTPTPNHWGAKERGTPSSYPLSRNRSSQVRAWRRKAFPSDLFSTPTQAKREGSCRRGSHYPRPGKVSSATALLSRWPRPFSTRVRYWCSVASDRGTGTFRRWASRLAMPESLAAWAAEK